MFLIVASTMKEKMIGLENRNEELEEEEIARELSNAAILKGVQHIVAEKGEAAKSLQRDLEKKLEIANEGTRMLQQHAVNMNEKVELLQKQLDQALANSQNVREEFEKRKEQTTKEQALLKMRMESLEAELKISKDGETEKQEMCLELEKKVAEKETEIVEAKTESSNLKSKCQKLEEEFAEQRMLLEATQEKLREIEEAKEKKRLKKKKGLRKLLFWK